MNRIQQVFENKKAFIPFITAGDPDLSVTEALVPAMAEAGADLIELGIPFPIRWLRELSSRRLTFGPWPPEPPQIKYLIRCAGYAKNRCAAGIYDLY